VQPRQDEPGRDPLVEEQTGAAAAEARAIGGPSAQRFEQTDPARRPVEEAGGGVAEGFEQSEELLAEAAEHREMPHSASRNAFRGEAESDLSGAEYAEADHERSSELSEDADTR
jgi:hypothetical protein